MEIPHPIGALNRRQKNLSTTQPIRDLVGCNSTDTEGKDAELSFMGLVKPTPVDNRRRRLRMMVESSTPVHAWRGFGLGAENLGNQEYGSARADISRVVAGQRGWMG